MYFKGCLHATHSGQIHVKPEVTLHFKGRTLKTKQKQQQKNKKNCILETFQ